MENEESIDFASDIQPYMFEPIPGENIETTDSSESDSSVESEDNIDEEFEKANAWRLSSLEWCKCGHCDLMAKAIECFCCLEKAVEYDEYDDKLKSAQEQCLTCITELPAFQQNISKDVLEVDTLQYIEENWPLDDEDLGRMHRLYRLVGYRRCSRWIFHILGKKCRRPLPACIYKCIRGKYSSPDGLYTHFKFPK